MKKMETKSKRIYNSAVGLALFCAGVIVGIAILDTKCTRELKGMNLQINPRQTKTTHIGNEVGLVEENSQEMDSNESIELMESYEDSELEGADAEDSVRGDTRLEGIPLQGLFADPENDDLQTLADDDALDIFPPLVTHDENNEPQTVDADDALDFLESLISSEEETGTTLAYFVSPKNDKLNWFEALQACAKRNMELVSINNPIENHHVVSSVKTVLAIANKSGEENYDVGNDFWTAGTNLWGPDNSEFYWATNGRLISEFTNWHAGTPNFPEEQHCIEITKEIDAVTAGTYKWNDYGCHIPARYICRAITLSSDIIN